MNEVTKKDIVSLIEVNHEEYLHYDFPKTDIASSWYICDSEGNIYES